MNISAFFIFFCSLPYILAKNSDANTETKVKHKEAKKPALCPDGQPPVHCKVNPCDVEVCPAYRQAKCRPNYCGGCKAEYYIHGQRVHCYCHNGKPPSRCPVNPCIGALCPDFPKAYCRPNSCQGCRADFFYHGKRVKCAPCPDGKLPVQCLVNPCDNAKCAAFPKAKCRPNYCGGCNADFYQCGQKVDCSKTDVCPDGKPPVACLINPCDVTKCEAFPDAVCRANFCGGCNAEFFVDDERVECSLCPKGQSPVQCLVNPCINKTCDRFPMAQCRPNFCGNCSAEFFLNGKLVDCALCPDGRPPVNCLIDPCEVTQCPAFPNARCKSNFCGGCNAEFFVKGERVSCELCNGKNPLKDPAGRDVRCARRYGPRRCPLGYRCIVHGEGYDVCCPAAIICPKGQLPVQCLVNPCDNATCPKHPEAKCRPNFCGECKAEFFLNNRVVNCALCPDGRPPVNCFADPCQVTQCLAHPNAECRSNYCGGCNAEFYVKGKRVSCEIDKCGKGRKPLKDIVGREIFCGRGPGRQDCPPGFRCNIDPADRFAVCCHSAICPKGQMPVQCLVNPCENATCQKHPSAKCRPNFCGECKAEFFINDRAVDCGLCPDGVPVVNCFADPCQVTQCPAHPNAECRSNYCGGCNAEFYVKGKRVTCEIEKCGKGKKPLKNMFGREVFCGRGPGRQDCPPGFRCNIDPADRFAVCCPTAVCPKGEEPVNCLVNPCDNATCLNQPSARCRPNLCGECKAEFFIKTRVVDCALCPDGHPPVNCFADPCQVTQCPAHPSAECRSNFCGGCNAEFFIKGKRVSCAIEKCDNGKKPLKDIAGREIFCGRGPTQQDCPPGFKCNIHPTDRYAVCCPTVVCKDNSMPVVCKRDPCRNADCPNYATAKCRPNYCGNCKAEFYVKNKKVNCRKCPKRLRTKKCPVNPCIFSRCPPFPRATCRPKPCSDRSCDVVFIENGKVVDCRERFSFY